MKLKKLPLGTQNFKTLIEGDYLYIDKTRYILEMVKNGRVYFLSRPRRFGKSLLVSTLENLFKGERNLFKGLYIYDKWNWDKTSPVIKIDFSARTKISVDEFKESLNIFLEDIAEEYGIKLKYKEVEDKFDELIKRIAEKTSKKVVVLIDEYDKPILDNITDSEVRESLKTFLSSFYGRLKSQDENLDFVFITGVSKFVGTSIFSGLNSPDDLTLDEDFSCICGYSQKDVKTHFREYINLLADKYLLSEDEILDEIKKWYNGYSWDGKNFLYNPQSIMNLFKKKEFGNYWFSSGTPTFLIHLLKEKNNLKSFLSDVKGGSEIIDSYDPDDNMPTVPLMFQTGYLSIKKKEYFNVETEYSLAIPNEEVKNSLLKHLLTAFANYPINNIDKLRKDLIKSFLNKDSEKLNLKLKEVFGNIPYHLHQENEAYYHSLFLLCLYLLGFKVDGEISTDKGRIDGVLIYENQAFIIEIKFSKEKENPQLLVKKALKQINDKKYYEKYLSYDITLLSIAYTNKDIYSKFQVLEF